MDTFEAILIAVSACVYIAIICYACFGGGGRKRPWRRPIVVERKT
jgi:hypothetical protein